MVTPPGTPVKPDIAIKPQNIKVGENTPAHIDRVTVKLPPFWTSNPRLWFHSIEAQFKIAGIIDDQTKFYYVVGALDERYLKIIGDILEHPPDKNKYDTIRDKLINCLKESDTTRLQRLLKGMVLGEQKPSQLLSGMRMTSNNDLSDQALRNLWLQQLPREMQAILAVSNEGLEAIAILADKIYDVLPSINFNLNQVDHKSPESHVSRSNKPCCSYQHSHNERSHSRNRSNNRSASVPRDKKYCWYHFRFGKKAKKCGDPDKCQYKSLNN